MYIYIDQGDLGSFTFGKGYQIPINLGRTESNKPFENEYKESMKVMLTTLIFIILY